MHAFTATYSPEDNKLRLYATSRLDTDLYARAKAAGFSWAPRQQLFVAPMWTPEREDLLIELAGTIDDEDTSLVERAEERANRFDDYRDNRLADAASAEKGVRAIMDSIPPGQPILVGHHSEARARRDKKTHRQRYASRGAHVGDSRILATARRRRAAPCQIQGTAGCPRPTHQADRSRPAKVRAKQGPGRRRLGGMVRHPHAD